MHRSGREVIIKEDACENIFWTEFQGKISSNRQLEGGDRG